MILRENASLKNYNTFHINHKAEKFLEITSVEDFQELAQYIENKKYYILGEGSNTLFLNDFKGVIIKNSLDYIEIQSENSVEKVVRVGGGTNWDKYVEWSVESDLYGIENLKLIPGTVGAAPVQNIGAYGCEVKDVIKEVRFWNLEKGEIEVFPNKMCNFGYRNSVFKTKLKDKVIIIEVTFNLSKKKKLNIEYLALKKKIEEKKLTDDELNSKVIAGIIKEIRESKLPDPDVLGNAGSFFKNPEITIEELERLREKLPEIPVYNSGDLFKVPAAYLIEKAGLKGKRYKNTGTFEKQALVIVNYGVNSGEEIKEFASYIIEEVYKKFDIKLNPEVNFVK